MRVLVPEKLATIHFADRPPIPHTATLRVDVVKWLDANCDGDWKSVVGVTHSYGPFAEKDFGTFIEFTDDRDAVLFKTFWL